eukprot:gnl/TRDRNA2_/TRDRNA2_37881_c0_seq1.p1 gnl/TRDRNA2_/TRDRNA2_37881_c0~~gnl/TRDRNA2_/TRDRNA2_37881_c0_seq1.p1  ORF type:complete len:159 (+),score=15.15 gnl/TRDRNA2_/TRDRNA2_37881_c0_seq1:118-594(+)
MMPSLTMMLLIIHGTASTAEIIGSCTDDELALLQVNPVHSTKVEVAQASPARVATAQQPPQINATVSTQQKETVVTKNTVVTSTVVVSETRSNDTKKALTNSSAVTGNCGTGWECLAGTHWRDAICAAWSAGDHCNGHSVNGVQCHCVCTDEDHCTLR